MLPVTLLRRPRAALLALVSLLSLLGAGVCSLPAPGATAAVARTSAAARDTPPTTGACVLPHRKGIDARHVYLGNVADFSGPVPGLHESAQYAVTAFVAYFNSVSDLCGRDLVLRTYDSKTDAGADQQAYAEACRRTFAVVGSVSAFDGGGASTAQACGVPDLRAATTSAERKACTTCLTTHPEDPTKVPHALPDLLKRSYGGGDKAALLYLDDGAHTARADAIVKSETARGMSFVYVQGVSPAEFNYAPYVFQMMQKGVETVQLLSDSPAFGQRVAQTMTQLSYTPKVLVAEPVSYSDPQFSDSGIPTIVPIDTQPLATATPSKELQLYRTWLQRTRPGATPTVEGIYAWSAARLFTVAARSVEPRLSRLQVLRALRTVDDWRDGYLHAPQHVGSGAGGDCLRFLRFKDDAWVPIDGSVLRCG